MKLKPRLVSGLVVFLLAVSCNAATVIPPTITFPVSYISLKENVSIGTRITTVTAHGRGGKNVIITYGNDDTKKLVNINMTTTGVTATANVYLKTKLDRETLSERIFIVKACDCRSCASCQNYAIESMTIFVSDVNDEHPLFQNQPYQLEIEENATINSQFTANITAKDADNGQGGQVHYEIVPSGQAKDLYNGAFAISRITGVITLKKELDYETLSFYQYTVRASDHYNLSSTAELLIKIKDIQDKPPFFQGLPYRNSIPENITSIGTEVLQIKASDGDTGVPHSIVYEFENGGRCSEFFNLSQETGQILTAKELDVDDGILKQLGGYCLINVTAREVDGGKVLYDNKSVSITLVTVDILDINDNGPVFNQSDYQAEVNENTTNIPVTIHGNGIKVQDIDQTLNSVFDITVLYDNGTTYPYIDPSPSSIYGNGDVLLRLKSDFKGYDYEKEKNVTIHILARETKTKERRNSSCTVHLKINDVNDHDPEFGQNEYVFNVTENVLNNTHVGQTKATDGDSGVYGNVTYRLRGTENKFTIDSLSGEILTVGDNTTTGDGSFPLNRERKDVYYLTVEAEDGGHRRSVASLLINVLDANDETPKFDRGTYAVSIKENSRDFSNGPLTLEATDNDKPNTNNSYVRYKLGSALPKEFRDHFEVNGTSGVVRVKNSIDYEAINRSLDGKISLNVIAYDAGSPSLSSTSTIVVRVIDENDFTPIFSKNVTCEEIPEDTKPGHFVARVTATDDDAANPNNQFSYFIGKGSDKFKVGSSDGNITVELNAKFDREVIDKYNLTIIAIDKGDPQRTGTALTMVQILDVNDEKPNFEKTSYSANINESLRADSSIIQCKAKDKDFNSSLFYEIIEVTAKNYEGERINSSLVENYFRISPTNGKVYVNTTLDAETATQLTLTLNVTDMYGVHNIPQTSTVELIIEIQDVNDNPPRFQDADRITAELPENAVKDTIVLTVHATDKDIATYNRRINYSLVENPLDAFKIDRKEGKITLKSLGKIDREKNGTLLIRVMADDSVNNSTVLVNVTVLDANDNTPFFLNTTYNFSLEEGNYTNSSVEVGRIYTHDNDIGGNANVTYTLNPTDDRFQIDPITGVIVAAGDIDRESHNGQVILTVEAADNPDDETTRHINTTRVTIALLDRNDNTPTFSATLYQKDILETESIGSNVLTVSATDPDNGDNGTVSYSLGPTGNSSNLFQIDNTTGVISVNESLTDNVKVFQMDVIASDDGSPPLNRSVSVFITVRDVNNNGPEFNLNTREFSVFECATLGTKVAQINATDKDNGEYGRITYSFMYSNNSHGLYLPPFEINETSGRIALCGELDKEVTEIYTIIVRVQDHGFPTPLSQQSGNLRIKVLDINDNPPEFTKEEKNKTASVLENSSNITVTTVKAHDNDSNSQIAYELDSSMPYANNFSIDSRTGQIFLITPLDREMVEVISLRVTAKDVTNTAGNLSAQCKIEEKPRNATSMTLTVKILDKDDNHPVFKKKQIRSSILRDQPINATVMDLKEYVLPDPDTPEFSVHRFFLYNVTAESQTISEGMKHVSTKCMNGATTPICVDTDGKVKSNMVFSADMKGFFALYVLVNDSAGGDTAVIKINLIGDSQLGVMLISGKKTAVNDKKNEIFEELSAVTNHNFVFVSLTSHTEQGNVLAERSDLQFYVTDPKNNDRVLEGSELDKLIDNKGSQIKKINEDKGLGIEKMEALHSSTSKTSSIQIEEKYYFIAAIALLVVTLTIVIIFYVKTASKYKRRMKAAFSATSREEDKGAVHLPGSNRFSSIANPLLNKEEELRKSMENLDNISDSSSQNSLDMNDVDEKRNGDVRHEGSVEDREVIMEMYNDESNTGITALSEALENYEQSKKQTKTISNGFINPIFGTEDLETTEV